jgi:hypothetical protein
MIINTCSAAISFARELENVSAKFYEDLSHRYSKDKDLLKFYSDAAEQSKSLMADVPRAFKMVAKKKANRQSRLKSLLGEKG